MNEPNNPNIDTERLGVDETEELGEQIKESTTPINIDQKEQAQDYLEVSQGVLKIASTKLDLSYVVALAVDILKDKNIQKLLNINNKKNGGSYLG